MKFTRSTLLFAGLIMAIVMCLASIGCSTLGTEHQKIGAACETSAAAMDAITAAKVAGVATTRQHADALAVFRTTVPFCQPVAEKLAPDDYYTLVRAAAALTLKRAEVKP